MDGSEEPIIFQESYDIACKIIEGLDFFEYSDEKFAGVSYCCLLNFNLTYKSNYKVY